MQPKILRWLNLSKFIPIAVQGGGNGYLQHRDVSWPEPFFLAKPIQFIYYGRRHVRDGLTFALKGSSSCAEWALGRLPEGWEVITLET